MVAREFVDVLEVVTFEASTPILVKVFCEALTT